MSNSASHHQPAASNLLHSSEVSILIAQAVQAALTIIACPYAGPQEPPPPIAMDASRVVMHEIVLPHMGDFMQICFGGQVLSWIDICAGLAAKAVRVMRSHLC